MCERDTETERERERGGGARERAREKRRVNMRTYPWASMHLIECLIWCETKFLSAAWRVDMRRGLQ